MDPKSRIFRPSPVEREQILHAIRRALETRPQIVFAYVHGSFLENRPAHDIDVAVYLAPGIEDGLALALELAAELEKAIPPALQLPVDVHLLNRAPTSFRYHAFRGQLILSQDEDVRGTIVERTVAMYFDRKPILDRALKEAMTA
jgi:predicted nucleotidyltransferase